MADNFKIFYGTREDVNKQMTEFIVSLPKKFGSVIGFEFKEFRLTDTGVGMFTIELKFKLD